MFRTLPAQESQRTYRVREGLHLVRMEDEAVVYDLVQDAVHYLNATARWIWEACEQGQSEENMVVGLKQRYDLDGREQAEEAELRNDVERTLATLVGQGLIVVDAE